MANMQAMMTAQLTAFTERVDARIEDLEVSAVKRRRTRSPTTVKNGGNPPRDSSPRDSTVTAPPQPSTSTTAATTNLYFRQDDNTTNREFVPYINTFKTPAAQQKEKKDGRTPFYEALSPADDADADRADAVNDLLTAAGSKLAVKKGNNVLAPHRYVLRGNRTGKVGLDQSSFPEYVAAMCRMLKDKAMPTSWLVPLQEHLHQLAIMGCTYDWPICRTWSENVFLMIADGRLPYGWDDQYAIKDVQRDATLIAYEQKVRRATKNGHNENYGRTNATTGSTTARSDRPDYARPSYDKDLEGKPCHAWNRGDDCGNNASHGSLPDRSAHICAWCVNKYAKANPHKERDCQNKRRFNERKNGANKSETSQDFR